MGVSIDPTIIVAIIAAGGSVASAYLTAGARRDAAQARQQVEPSAADAPNTLRDEISRVLCLLDDIAESQRRQDGELAALRAELQLERRERIALADRIDR